MKKKAKVKVKWVPVRQDKFEEMKALAGLSTRLSHLTAELRQQLGQAEHNKAMLLIERDAARQQADGMRSVTFAQLAALAGVKPDNYRPSLKAIYAMPTGAVIATDGHVAVRIENTKPPIPPDFKAAWPTDPPDHEVEVNAQLFMGIAKVVEQFAKQSGNKIAAPMRMRFWKKHLPIELAFNSPLGRIEAIVMPLRSGAVNEEREQHQ